MRTVRSNGDPAEFARIQPVHETAFARIDDHVPRSAVEVIDHRLPAPGAVEDPIAGILTARQNSTNRRSFKSANSLDNGDEAAHLDQRAETAWAGEQRMALQPTVRQRGGTDRAEARALVEHLQVFDQVADDIRQLLLTAAVVAHEETPGAVDPHGCPTVVAVRHDGIIGEGGRDN